MIDLVFFSWIGFGNSPENISVFEDTYLSKNNAALCFYTCWLYIVDMEYQCGEGVGASLHLHHLFSFTLHDLNFVC